jgi:23S rRNA (cytosine1962-C5)-methyltransferase
MMDYPVLTLKKKLEKRYLFGHDWIFSNELEPDFKHLESGSIVDVVSSTGKWVGRGFVNPSSLISFRVLTRTDVPIDADFFRNRLKQALDLRKKLIKSSNAYRAVYAESDGMPGLLIDVYNDVVSVQINSAGFELKKKLLIELLDELLSPKAIVLRNNHYHRTLEYLPEEHEMAKGFIEDAKTSMNEHGLIYEVDVYSGQKTGLYLDQRENRMWFRSLIQPGDRVFDGFCNEAGFALNAKVAGAGEVIGVDISDPVLERAKANAVRNNLDIRFEKKDLMRGSDDLREVFGEFDVVNLDPPNFTRSRKNVPIALKGYEKMHRMGLSITKPGGFMVTASCSHHILEDDFLDTVNVAAYKEKRTIKLIHKSLHPADHPVHPSMEETEYLKLFAFAVH